MAKSHVIGIDLGTSNCALCSVDLAGENSAWIVTIPQITGPGRIEEKPGLPSALYVSNAGEFPDGSLDLPWSQETSNHLVGQFARTHGALATNRLVTSAKSWLSNPHIDPKSAVLPWCSTIPDEDKVSAVDATTRYLQHLNATVQHQQPDTDLEEAAVIITVPASFQEVARNLTLEAAEGAGFGEVVLLEEPQAAFYAWVNAVGDGWREQVAPGDVVLVCDVGGGTTDFSLIAVTESDGQLGLERISVGEHLLLGGDNIDLGLAYIAQAQLAEEGHEIDDWQLWALVHGCREAKVSFFTDPSLTEVSLAVPSRGSSLIAGSLSATLTRESVQSMIIDGFFPMSGIDDLPSEDAAGLQEFGLPYASDPVISKHLARFLQRSLTNVRASKHLQALVAARPEATAGSFLLPNAILFNGGLFNAEPVRQRVLDLLASWQRGAESVRELSGFEPGLAVAKGACLYGSIRETGEGIRIAAGAARSYYVGLESSMPAVPGFRPLVKGLCVVPQGMEEGTELVIEDQEFGLVTGQPAEFRFFCSEIRSGDIAGDVVPNAERDLQESACLNVTLPTKEGLPVGEAIPVKMNAVVTELGNLQLWMKHEASGERWKFELEVRGD